MVHAVGALGLCALAALRAAATAWNSSDCEGCEGQTSLLQMGLEPMEALARAADVIDPTVKLNHYWPHWRGHRGHYAFSPYSIVTEGNNLSKSLLWSKDFTMSDKLFGTVIDYQRNLYVAGMRGLRKISPEGNILWTHDSPAFFAVLAGNAVCSQNNLGPRVVYCLSQQTGEQFWSRIVHAKAGYGENSIEAINGILFVASGIFDTGVGMTPRQGQPNDRIIALDASTGSELWEYVAKCGLWTFASLFPDDDSMVFHDMCGGLYRLTVQTGAEMWYMPGVAGTISDAAATLGPDGNVYACYPPIDGNIASSSSVEVRGYIHKVDVSNGAVLWTAETPTPCANTPAVSQDGKTVVVAPGAIPPVDGPFYYYRWQTKNLAPDMQHELKRDYDQMALNGTLRSFFKMPPMTGSIMGFDAATGAVQFTHDVPAWGSITAAGDQERNWETFIVRNVFDITLDEIKHDLQNNLSLPHCIAAHWTAATFDAEGRVNIGESVGKIRVYDPKTDVELSLETGDAVLPPGAAAAPGIMVFTTCQKLFVFKATGR